MRHDCNMGKPDQRTDYDILYTKKFYLPNKVA